jgi:hypothetical protein
MVLTDMSPTFAGVVDLVLDPLTGSNVGQVETCALTGGMVSIVYKGTLTFVEETSDRAA